jgi:NitT/TauT family transport system permease protein/taurine transport system permease protein
MTVTPRLMRWILIAALLAAWEFLPPFFGISEVLIPPLSLTIEAGFGQLGTFVEHFLVTLREAAAAVFLSCVLGVSIGAALGANKFLSRALLPVASSLYAVPLVILYPLFTVWMGIGPASKIAFGAFFGLFPTLLATASGVATIPRQYRVLSYSLRLSLFQETVRVLIPATIPTVLNGLRLGGALAIVGVIVSEMLASTAGLGFLISYYRTLLDTPLVFFGILFVIVLVTVFDLVMRRLEFAVRHWMPSRGDGTGDLALAAG